MSVTFVLGLSLVLLLVIFAVSAVLHEWQKRNLARIRVRSRRE